MSLVGIHWRQQQTVFRQCTAHQRPRHQPRGRKIITKILVLIAQAAVRAQPGILANKGEDEARQMEAINNRAANVVVKLKIINISRRAEVIINSKIIINKINGSQVKKEAVAGEAEAL